jgi:hypothetical protein
MKNICLSSRNAFFVIFILWLLVFSSCSTSPVHPQPTTQQSPPVDSIQASEPPPLYINPDNWASVPRTLVSDLKQRLDNKQKVLIVDVRSLDEYSADHLPGAVSAPLNDIVSGKWSPGGNISDQIVIY